MDTFGDEKFGKRIGGDISEAKKTWLFVTALERMNQTERKDFIKRYNHIPKTETEVQFIRQTFSDLGIEYGVRAAIDDYTHTALDMIKKTSLPATTVAALTALAHKLAGRQV